MSQKPFLALVIPAVEMTGQPGLPPGQAPGGPGQSPGLPPGQVPPLPTHPIVIEPPELPEVDAPVGSKLVLVWDGQNWQWAMVAPGQPAQPIAPTPSPKR
jgi:hypothetical protein